MEKKSLVCTFRAYRAIFHIVIWSFVVCSLNFVLNQNALAKTIYVGSAETYTNLQAAMTAMAGGDTLIIRDGTYAGTTNVINSLHYPPNGTAGAFTTIKAEHDGKVTFDGEDARSVFQLIGSSVNHRKYISFEGLIWCHTAWGTWGYSGSSPNGTNQSGLVSVTYADHIKFLRCGAYDGHPGYGDHGFEIYSSDHILYEECFAFGQMDYNFMAAKSSSEIIFRRCVARHDMQLRYGEQGAFVVYGSKNVEFQNCIALDADTGLYTDYLDAITYPGAAYFRYAEQGFDLANVNYSGCVSINNLTGRGVIGSTIGTNTAITFTNCIHWGAFAGSRTRYDGATFNHFTTGNITGDSSSSWAKGLFFEANTKTVSNSIIYGVANNYGVYQGYSTYNCLYNNKYNYYNANNKVGDITNINPLTTSLKYLTRIETGSDLKGVASDGGDIGATVLKKIGVDGTFWGEDGYNEVTNDNLWPFPSEDLIRTTMRAYTGPTLTASSLDGVTAAAKPVAIDGKRGFCADGQTLTRYIWEYLGNPIPSEIYAGNATTTELPGAPKSLDIVQ